MRTPGVPPEEAHDVAAAVGRAIGSLHTGAVAGRDRPEQHTRTARAAVVCCSTRLQRHDRFESYASVVRTTLMCGSGRPGQ